MMISYLDEALISIRVVKAFNAVKFVTGRFKKKTNSFLRFPAPWPAASNWHLRFQNLWV
jgi:hypothetical protein